MNKKTIFILGVMVAIFSLLFVHCSKEETPGEPTEEKITPKAQEEDYFEALLKAVKKSTQLSAEIISYESFVKGKGPGNFKQETGAEYKPSYNEDPAIPAQCWIETGYGTQNACKYCHTNYLAGIKHGNAFPIGEDQVLFSFPSPNLNKINWKNITHPDEILKRLKAENIKIPQPDDPENLEYVRTDNWTAIYQKARPGKDMNWDNRSQAGNKYQLFPALNPQDLFPYKEKNPTENGAHGYIDQEGFVKDRQNKYTGWRAVNFFPYAIFTPLTGSVSGIYLRLPGKFMTADGSVDISVYKKNLDLLEKVIKNDPVESESYYGDASGIKIQKGFYPVGTEFAHPLHYVDLNADGDMGTGLDGLNKNETVDYEFPGTRSKRVKEIRYMYKWKEVTVDDIGDVKDESEYGRVIGKEWQGWIDNKAGWILAAYIENRSGHLRPQTTEELLQCLGCHSSVGNTIDAVWSFQRKLPGDLGWQEMNYGQYKKNRADKTRLNDYQNENINLGELEYFYYSVVGADLFGVMPLEIEEELKVYAAEKNLVKELGLKNSLALIFDDEKLKNTEKVKRKVLLTERAQIMRHYVKNYAYLYKDETGEYFVKGTIYYPSESTMKANIAGYRRILLDQSFNLGKNTFGTTPEAIPFTLRSDGAVKNAKKEIIPVGLVIDSRPWDEEGVGNTPTGLAAVNEAGEPLDKDGRVVDVEKNPEKVAGHISTGGTFDTLYNPIIKRKLKVKR